MSAGATAGHYLRRFFTSLSRRPPTAADEQWARARLTPAQCELLARLDDRDRRHLIASAREVAEHSGEDSVWVVAALLHDVGKHAARLGTTGRVAATLVSGLLGRARVQGWAGRPGLTGRLGRYELHGEIGADEIRRAGGPEEAAWWSELHHAPDRAASGPIPATVLAVLDAADR